MKDSFYNLSSRNYNLYFWISIHFSQKIINCAQQFHHQSLTVAETQEAWIQYFITLMVIIHQIFQQLRFWKGFEGKVESFWTHKQTTWVFMLKSPNIKSKKSGKAGFWHESVLWGWRQVACRVLMRCTWVIGMQL